MVLKGFPNGVTVGLSSGLSPRCDSLTLVPLCDHKQSGIGILTGLWLTCCVTVVSSVARTIRCSMCENNSNNNYYRVNGKKTHTVYCMLYCSSNINMTRARTQCLSLPGLLPAHRSSCELFSVRLFPVESALLPRPYIRQLHSRHE